MFNYPFWAGFACPPECPICYGLGQITYDGIHGQTCDLCDGRGTYLSPAFALVLCAALTVTTAGPLIWWLW